MTTYNIGWQTPIKSSVIRVLRMVLTLEAEAMSFRSARASRLVSCDKGLSRRQGLYRAIITALDKRCLAQLEEI